MFTLDKWGREVLTTDEVRTRVLLVLMDKPIKWRTAVRITNVIYNRHMLDSNDSEYRRVLRYLNDLYKQGRVVAKQQNRYKPIFWKYVGEEIPF